MIYLYEIEQEVARRCGDFRKVKVTTHDAGAIISDELQSTIALGGLSDMFVLRRGRISTDARGAASGEVAINSVGADDRRRLAADYIPGSGTLAVDRAYLIPTQDAATLGVLYTGVPPGEEVELMALDPTNELRVAVLSGLRRCYFVNRVAIATVGVAAERDLTASLAYLEELGALYDLSWSIPTNAIMPPERLDWYRPFLKDGHVWVTAPDVFPYTLYATVRAPFYNYPNAAYNVNGPSSDLDTFNCALEYAAAFGHAEMWRLFPHRMRPLAEAGMGMKMEDVAKEATKMARRHFTGAKPRRFPQASMFTTRQVESNAS